MGFKVKYRDLSKNILLKLILHIPGKANGKHNAGIGRAMEIMLLDTVDQVDTTIE